MKRIRIIDNSFSTYGTRLSDNIFEDNNGQLIIHNAVLARCGEYEYLESEILKNGNPNKIVKVYREPKDVFDPVSIASFENKPFCNEHPREDVMPKNVRELQAGFMRDIRRGDGEYVNCLLGDIVVTDPDVIDAIKDGKRELSLGYNANIVLGDDGNYYMTHIRGNHLALVDNGRAGIAVIRDKKTVNNTKSIINKEIKGDSKMGKKVIYKPVSRDEFINKLYDEDVVEIEELEDADVDESKLPDVDAPAEVVEESVSDAVDNESPIARLEAKLDKIIAMLENNAPAVVTAPETATTDEEVTTDMTENTEPTLYDAEEDNKQVEEVVEETSEVEEEDEEDEDEMHLGDSAPRIYKKLTEIKDSKEARDISESVNASFQNRYAKFGGKN